VVFGPTVDETSPVTEAHQVQRPDVHDRLEQVELFVGRLDVLAVSVDGRGETVLVCPTRAPTSDTLAPPATFTLAASPCNTLQVCLLSVGVKQAGGAS
jgi:hypothetical protein